MYRPTVSLALSSGERSGWRGIDRRRHGDDDEIGVGEIRRVVRGAEMLRVEQIRGRHLAGRVDVVPQVLDPLLGQVVADGRPLSAECHGHRQADVAEADHGHGGELLLGRTLSLRALQDPIDDFSHALPFVPP